MSNKLLERNLIQRVCVGDLATRAAARFPTKIAIKEGDTNITFHQFNEQVNRCGHALLKLGLNRQDRVAIMFLNSWEMLVCYFACAKAGLVVMPINLGLKPHEIAYCMKDSQAKVLIGDGMFASSMSEVVPKLPDLEHVVWARLGGEVESMSKSSYQFEDFLATGSTSEVEVIVDDRDTVQLLYTSGTTSMPKGVKTSHVAVTITALSSGIQNKIDHHDTSLIILPLFHCAMLNASAVPNFIACGTLVLFKGFDAKLAAEAIEREKVTNFVLLPMMYQALLAEPGIKERNFSSVRMACYAMAPMPEARLQAIREVFTQANVILGSGQTEFTPPTTFQRPEHQFDKAGSWGPSTPSVHVEIMDEEGNILPRGQLGEIVYRGPQCMTEYLNMPEQTEEAFKYGWFHSGDIAWMDEEGVIWFTDRKKDMIKSGGENVASIEVERCLLEHPAVMDASAVGLPHPYWGESVTAMITCKPGQKVSEDEIIDFCKQRLAGFKVPKKVLFIDEFPRTGTGKILKHVLRKEHADVFGNEKTS